MKILIAVPCMDMVPVAFCHSLAQLQKVGDCYLTMKAGSLIYTSRNSLATEAIKSEADYVFWLDSDMVFTPEIVEDLMFSGKEIVTGIAHSRRPPYSSCIFTEIYPGVQKWKGEYPKSTFEIAACGMACCLMSTEVLSAVHDKFGMAFQPTPEYGEDVAFCWRASQCGYKIWAEPGVRVGHVGRRVIYPEDWEGDK